MTIDREAAVARSRPGRRRDPALDALILEAALDELAEAGYERTTVDAVAARAGAARATVYRRWPTKLALVEGALRRLAPDEVELSDLPDTGSLRGDLLAATRDESAGESDRRGRVVAGLHTAAGREPELDAVLREAGTGPWITANRLLIQRAVDRGEVPAADVDVLAQVLPLMCTARIAVERLPVTAAWAAAVIDGVLLPALRGGAEAPRATPSTERSTP